MPASVPHPQNLTTSTQQLRDAGRDDATLAMLRRHTQTHPQDYDGWISLALFLQSLGRDAELLAPFRAALALRNDPAARNALVTALWRLGQIEAAQAEGLLNLRLKDDLSLQNFMASPFNRFRLRAGGKGFDPENPSRNIIAFSLWGDRPEYVTGALVNAQISQHIYVNWTARFYCDHSVPEEARRLLRAYGAEVVMMERTEHQRIRPLWRFLASDDPKVNVFICRDADSRLNGKELNAVHDWLKSGKRFHVMRDHIYHMELILAGMWGGQAGVLPPLADWLGQPALETRLHYFDNHFGDQAFLSDFIWPLIRGESRIHDTFYRYPRAMPFPDGYELPGLVHVGGAVKTMPHFSDYPVMPQS